MRAKKNLNMVQKQQFGLTAAGKQAVRNAADPNIPHSYQWFVIERFGQEGERLYTADSLTGAIDRFNGIDCDSKRLGVTKDEIATVDLVIADRGETRIDEGYQSNPRFSTDDAIADAAVRLRLSIAGLDHSGLNMTLGGM